MSSGVPRRPAAEAVIIDRMLSPSGEASSSWPIGHDGEALYRQLTGPQHDAVMQRLQQGTDAGQIRADADLEAVADALIGSILYRVLARPATTDETLGHLDGLIDALITGVRKP